LTINVDESLENIRSGTNGIIISLPKQKHLSYLLRFCNQEGKLFIILNYNGIYIYMYFLDAVNFNKLLESIKSGKNIDDTETSQFDERTEESSAQQYFQVFQFFIKKKFYYLFSFMVIYLNNKI